jgi:glycosyltransferase involved in cell wall biosynthesis
MKLCAISFKECWQNDRGEWFSSGGFPLQMAAIGSIFDEMTLLITRGPALPGGIPLPPHARVIPLRHPVGQDTRRKLSVLANLPNYLKIITRHIRQADVVHTPLPGDLPLLGLLIALALRKPLIGRYGGSWADNSQTTFMDRVAKAIMRRFAGDRNVMLATGEGTVEPAPNMHWIFVSALTRAEIQQASPVLNRGLSTPPSLVYAGRLSPEKGVMILINALAELKREGFLPLPRLVLAGEGPQRSDLEQAVAASDCTELVHFAGQLDRAALSKQFLEADVCVQPSLTEGFSKAWLDAMAHGLPVLTTSVGAAQDVIGADGERGWIIPPNDVNALAGALRKVLAGRQLDWPALRRRCRVYTESLTLEDWALSIGKICSQQWKIALIDGKLRS